MVDLPSAGVDVAYVQSAVMVAKAHGCDSSAVGLREQSICTLHAVAIGAISLGILDEVRVAIVQPEIGKTHVRLLPADHPVAVVAQDHHGQVHLQPYSSFQFLAVHHEAAVTAHRHHRPVRAHQVCGHRRRQAGTRGRQGVARVHAAVTRAFSLLCLPDALQRFHNRYPDARLTIRDAFVSEILPMLRDGTIDVAITSLLPEVLGADLSFEPLGDVAVAISARAGAFSRDAYRLADLTESVWLLDHSHGGTSERGRQWFAEHDVPLLAQIIECPSSMASLVLTTQGKAIAPVPQAILSIPWLAPLLSEIHLEEPLPTTPIGLVKRKGNVPDAPVGWFVESARLAIAAVLGLNLDKLRE